MSIHSISIAKRVRRRVVKGELVEQVRYVLDFKDPQTGARRQLFFTSLAEAKLRRKELNNLAERQTRTSAPVPMSGALRTVSEVVAYWLEGLSKGLKAKTIDYYHQMARYVTDPLPAGSTLERRSWARKGKVPDTVRLIPMLGDVRVVNLTTSQIRSWHGLLVAEVGTRTANGAKKVLKSALERAAEDFGVVTPSVPRASGKLRSHKKSILSLEQVAVLLAAAWDDEERGIYYAFPFLAGSRPSEQLALLWRDVDVENGIIHIRRMQELDGSICNFTKTPASVRDVPMSPFLRALFVRWRTRRLAWSAPEDRVFAPLGTNGSLRHVAGSGPLTYWNFRNTYWRPVFKSLGLPAVSPHSARHTFISTLQAQGVEIGLVAKLAGHANPNVTIGYYTHAMRTGQSTIRSLDEAYEARPGR